MGLFDVIFKPRQVIKAAHDAKAYFKTLTAYQPVFRTWRGAIYESELVRSAIDARARHISKLKIEIIGSAKPSLQAKLRLGPNKWQTWSQFLYRVSTILDNDNTCFIVPIQNDDLEVTGYFPVISESCSLDRIAHEVNLSPNYLHTAFKEAFGETPYAYVTRKRIEKAKRLIAAGRESMLTIALETGFCSQSHFNKVFKAHTGMTPKEYRNSIVDIY